MKFEELKIINEWICALVYDTNKDKYMIFLAQSLGPKLEITESNQDIIELYGIQLFQITKSKSASINIPLVTNNDTLFHLITLNNKAEYTTIISTLEVILNE